MKKLLTIAAFVSAASLSFGQGLVSFQNNVSSATHVATNAVNTTGGPAGGPTTGRISGAAGSYYFALFVAPSTVTTVNNSLTGFTLLGIGTNTSLGRFYGNPTTDGTPVTGFNSGDTANFVIVGWSANIGTTWAQASAWWNNGNPAAGPGQGGAGWFGISSEAINTIVGGGPNPVPVIVGPTGGQIQGGVSLYYYPVPEPSTFALAGLGAAALLIFRRRK